MSRILRHGWILAAAATGLLAMPWTAQALEPADIAVLFNTRSPNSLRVARYYMNARKIPVNHLVPVTCDVSETIPEEFYRTSFAEQVRKGLTQRHLDVKCLVTTYDIPLRIFAREPTAAERAETDRDQKQLDQVLAALEQQIALYDALARPAGNATVPSPTPSPAAPAAVPGQPAEPKTLPAMAQRLNTAANAAARRIERAVEPTRSAALADFVNLQEKVAGAAGVLSTLHVTPDMPNAIAAQRQLSDLAAQVRAMQLQYQDLARQRDQPEIRKEMVELAGKCQGLLGEGSALQEIMEYLQPQNTAACLDSELALVLADQSYNRTNWMMNPKNIELYPEMQRLTPGGQGTPAQPGEGDNGIPRTILVTRLDGLSPAKVEEMIDTGLKIEAKGLDGKMYLDARGLRGADPYAQFDGDLRRAADWLKQHSTMDIVLEDTPALLAAKDAPDAALYCGWYSLRNYQPSGQWVPGAVGYHVASLEMETLHNDKYTGWVPHLLAGGFCGTLGATEEPYLTAFPKPSQFFPLLLSGDFTQGEVWEVTNPTLSWRIGYVGDPLYNPFKTKPRVKSADLKADSVLRNAYAILR